MLRAADCALSDKEAEKFLQLLGLDPTNEYSLSDCQKAFRKQARTVHPDQVSALGDKDKTKLYESKFSAVNDAHSRICKWFEWRKQGGVSDPKISAGAYTDTPFVAGTAWNPDDYRNGSSENKTASFSMPVKKETLSVNQIMKHVIARPTADTSAYVPIDSSTSNVAIERTITATWLQPCGVCRGSGLKSIKTAMAPVRICETCSGTGDCGLHPLAPRRCDRCAGLGHVISPWLQCETCQGSAYETRKTKYVLVVPRGHDLRQKIVVKGLGNRLVGSDRNGDLYITIVLPSGSASGAEFTSGDWTRVPDKRHGSGAGAGAGSGSGLGQDGDYRDMYETKAAASASTASASGHGIKRKWDADESSKETTEPPPSKKRRVAADFQSVTSALGPNDILLQFEVSLRDALFGFCAAFRHPADSDKQVTLAWVPGKQRGVDAPENLSDFTLRFAQCGKRMFERDATDKDRGDYYLCIKVRTPSIEDLDKVHVRPRDVNASLATMLERVLDAGDTRIPENRSIQPVIGTLVLV